MPNEAQRFLELLERRLYTLRLLAQEMKPNTRLYADWKLEPMQDSLAREENLALEVRSLTRELVTLTRQLGPAGGDPFTISRPEVTRRFGPVIAGRLEMLVAQDAAAQQAVRAQNRVRAAFLRRARRSVNVMMNCLAQFQGTYARPGAASGALVAGNA